MEDIGTTEAYTYWEDGKKVVVDSEFVIETVLELSDDYVDLDEFDGRNINSGEQFAHDRFYKIYKQDGKDVEDTYLLYSWSQWQDSIDTYEIMNLDDVIKHLEKKDRDVEEYEDKLKNL